MFWWQHFKVNLWDMGKQFFKMRVVKTASSKIT